jgi:acyl dehydratase
MKMALDIDKLGTTLPEHTATVDGERARAYAAATNDDNPAYESGKYAPPLFAVVPTWDSVIDGAATMIPPEALGMVVHGEHDIHYHQPLVPGQTLKTHGEIYAVRVGRSGTRFTSRIVSVDESGAPALEQFNTAFIRAMSDGDSGGPAKPDHAFPEDARSRPAGELSVHVDDDQTYRYRDASGDTMPIHVDDAFAKSMGLPGIIAHGLCTMAMCSQAVIKTVAGADPGRLKRLAVRFAKPVLPGNDVVVSIFDAGERDGRRVFAFEARSAGDVVIKDGLAEVET